MTSAVGQLNCSDVMSQKVYVIETSIVIYNMHVLDIDTEVTSYIQSICTTVIVSKFDQVKEQNI